MEISNLPDEGFKVMVIKMLTNLRRMKNTVRTLTEKEHIRKKQTEVTELMNTTTELNQRDSVAD